MVAKRSHHTMEYMVEHSKLTRKQIAEKIGVTPKTLYEWTYNITKVKLWMVDLVANASGIPLDRVPPHIRQRTDDDEARYYLSKTDEKNGVKAAPKEPPRIPKNPAADSMRAESARQKAPPSAPAKPAAHIYTDKELPDLAKMAMDKAQPYEMVLVPEHWIPCAEKPTIREHRCQQWWFKDLAGNVGHNMYQHLALEQVEKMRKKDVEALEKARKRDSEALSLDLI